MQRRWQYNILWTGKNDDVFYYKNLFAWSRDSDTVGCKPENEILVRNFLPGRWWHLQWEWGWFYDDDNQIFLHDSAIVIAEF